MLNEKSSNSDYDIVHTITDWYDGARAGVAGLHCEPHYYENRWDEVKGDWSEIYLLNRIDEETFQLAIEDWQILKRWQAAFREGTATQETHPALPEDRARHNELAIILSSRLVICEDRVIKATAEFKYGSATLVRWSIVDKGGK